MKLIGKLPVALFVLTSLLTVSAALQAAKKPAPTSVEGIFIKLDGSKLLMKFGEDRQLKDLSFETNEKTAVLIDGKPAKLTDLKADQRVIVSPPKGTAKQIEVKVPHGSKGPDGGLFEGIVVKVDAQDLVVRSPMQNGEIVDAKVGTDEKTSVLIGEKSAKLSDLKDGQAVVVAIVSGKARKVVVQAEQ